MRGHLAWALVVASLVSSSATARAEEAAGGDGEEVDLDELPAYEEVVVGGRVPEDLFRSDRSLSTVTEEQLSERNPRTVPEALWDAPGVFVQQTNHGGGSPILRGLIGPQNLILVDGVRLNNSVYRSGPIQYLNLVDPLSLRGIEVLRGPGSVLYGSDAMGGVMQLQPLTAESLGVSGQRGIGGRVLLRLGSADIERSAHAAVAARTSGLSVVGSGTYSAFDDLVGGRGIGQQDYSGYERWGALGGVTYRFDRGALAGSALSVGYLMSRIEDAGRTDKYRDRGSLQFYDNDDHLLYGRFHLLLPPLRTSGDLTLSWQGFFERKDAISMGEELVIRERTTRDETRADTLGLDLQLVTRPVGERLRLRYGATWYRDWVGARRYQRVLDGPWSPASMGAYPDGSTYDTYGAFLMVDGSPLVTEGGHELRLSGGYRYHGMAGYAPAGPVLDEADFTFDGHVFFGSAQYLLRQDLALAFTFSQGFRAPSLNEAVLLGDTGKYFHVPNRELGPERSDTFELLLRGRLSRVSVTAAGYVSLIHDLIRREETEWEGQTEIGDKPVAWNVNGGEGLLWGVETQLRVDLAEGFSFWGALTYTWGEERIEGADDVPLSRIPPLFGQVGLRWQSEGNGRPYRAFVETYVRFATDQARLSPEDERDVRIPEGGTPGWWTFGARAGVTVAERVALRLSIDNLLNEPYRYHGSGVYGPGTNAVLSAELLF